MSEISVAQYVALCSVIGDVKRDERAEDPSVCTAALAALGLTFNDDPVAGLRDDDECDDDYDPPIPGESPDPYWMNP